MWIHVLLALSSLFVSGQDTEADSVQLAADLQALVRLETPTKRQAKARALARRSGVAIEDWQDAMRAFGDFVEPEYGTRVEQVRLQVGDAVEETRMDLHVPNSYDVERPAPLLLAFHGTGGDGSYMVKLWSEVADQLGMIVVAPGEAGDNSGYAFSERERLAALAALRWARLRYNVDEDRIFATGVSRGGHLSWDLALRHPGLLAAIAPMIGSPRVQPRQGQNNIRYLRNVLDLPIRDLQGVGDDPGMIFNLKFVFERLEELGAEDAQLYLQEGLGHSFRFGEVDWLSFFKESKRNPIPTKLHRAVARPGEGRSYWVEVLETKKPVLEDFEVPMSARWRKADSEEQRVIIQEVADSKTGHVDVELTGPLRYEVKASKGIAELRLLIPQRAFIEGKYLEVKYNGKRIRRKPVASKEVLLLEFAERFDRRFLPVAEISVP